MLILKLIGWFWLAQVLLILLLLARYGLCQLRNVVFERLARKAVKVAIEMEGA